MILLLLLVFGIILIFIIAIDSIRFGITPTPTSSKVTNTLLKNLPKENIYKIIDLGSGTGTIARALAYNYPQSEVIGYERSLPPFLISLVFPKPNNLTFQRENFLNLSFNNIDLAYVYLCPSGMEKLYKKIQTDQPKNFILISNTFALPHIKPYNLLRVNDLYKTPLYFYKF